MAELRRARELINGDALERARAAALTEELAGRALDFLASRQRTDGGWSSEDGTAFDVQATFAAIRAVR